MLGYSRLNQYDIIHHCETNHTSKIIMLGLVNVRIYSSIDLIDSKDRHTCSERFKNVLMIDVRRTVLVCA